MLSVRCVLSLCVAFYDYSNAEVGAIHPKAMPVILGTPEEMDTWLAAPGCRLMAHPDRQSSHDEADRRQHLGSNVQQPAG
jgi:putative SOS response-associated peptidase YedK